MQTRAKKLGFKSLQYKIMDIFNMTFDDEIFDCVLDKGALDAVFPENKAPIKQNIEKLFKSIFRILK